MSNPKYRTPIPEPDDRAKEALKAVEGGSALFQTGFNKDGKLSEISIVENKAIPKNAAIFKTEKETIMVREIENKKWWQFWRKK